VIGERSSARRSEGPRLDPVAILIVVVAIALVWWLVSADRSDPVTVVTALASSRNVEDLDAVLDAYAPDAQVLGRALDRPGMRERLEEILRSQFVLDWRLDDSACEATGDLVRCTYTMDDFFLGRSVSNWRATTPSRLRAGW
jgi:hypothetical protein